MDQQPPGGWVRAAFARPNRPRALENLNNPAPYRKIHPLAATPDLSSPGTPPVQNPRVTFQPGSSTPYGLGIGYPPSSGGRYPGYVPIIERDPFQQDEDDSDLRTPQPLGTSTGSTLSLEQQPFASPYGAPFDYQSPYGQPLVAPPGGHDEPSFGSWLAKMIVAGWPMYFMFIVGVGFAAAHHSFYSRLHDRPANDQILMVRLGGLLSYASKACFVAAVVFAYRQQIWVTVMNKVLKLRTIDSLFEAVHEPSAFTNRDFLWNARVAACLAALVWLFPLTVILTPATLIVAPHLETEYGLCPNVRTLNFDSERTKNWRSAERINDYRVFSVSLYNSTVNNSSPLLGVPYNSTFFDYWTGSSTPVTLVAEKSALTGSVIHRPGAAVEMCGGGWNCSYEISFKAPTYNCSEVAKGPRFDTEWLWSQGAPQEFFPNELLPYGNYSYLAEAFTGDYASKHLDVAPGGAPIMEPPFPKNLGAFRTEPVLWIGYSRFKGSGRPPEDRDDPKVNELFESSVIKCEHWVVNYTVRFNHTVSDQTTTIIRRDFLHPVINTTYAPGIIEKDETLDNTTAFPKENYVHPYPDHETYRVIAAYHSIGSLVRSYVHGQVQVYPFAQPQTEATKTRLLNTETYLPVDDLPNAIQNFYENITLSLLSNPQFLIVTWAAKPDKRSGVSPPPGATAVRYEYPKQEVVIDEGYPYKYPCVRTRMANAYVFNRRDLWIAYAAAILVALLGLVLGSAALSQNGLRARDVKVSNIVAATRAPSLDALPWGRGPSVGGEFGRKWKEVPENVLDARLGYGVVEGSAGGWSPNGRGVSYGFIPEQVLLRQRPGRATKNRLSAFSFKTWEG